MAKDKILEGTVEQEKDETAEKVEQELERLTDTSGIKTFPLKEPVLYNGVEFNELTFDFNKLKGKDGIEVERELRRLGLAVVGHPSSNADYIIRIAVRACNQKIGIDIFDEMNIADYNKIRTSAYFFLLSLG